MSSASDPTQSRSVAPWLAVMCLVSLLAGCASSGQVQTSASVYAGVGYYDPWYMGPGYYPPPGTIGPPPPPPRPEARPPQPAHPIATPPSRPSPPPRPVATPRGGGGRR
jgi:hypothetical protein